MPVPTVQVWLDTAANDRSFPHNITGFVSLLDGIDLSTRGRADELAAVSPVVASFTLDNTDGRFSLGSTSGGYGAINVMRGVRIKVNGVNRFTGFVTSWPVAWPSGSDRLSRTAVVAVDARERWGRKVLRTRLVEAAVSEGAHAFYPFNEPAEAVDATDQSGRGSASISLSGFGLTMEAGVDEEWRRAAFTGDGVQLRSNFAGIAAGTPGFSFDPVYSWPFAGLGLAKPIRWISFRASTNATATGYPIVWAEVFNNTQWSFQLTETTISWWGGGAMIHYADTAPGTHDYLFVADGVNAKFYVDGVLKRTTPYTAVPASPSDRSGVILLTHPTFTATVSNLAVGDQIPASPDQAAVNLHWAATAGTAYDTLGVRTKWAADTLGTPADPSWATAGVTRFSGRDVNGVTVAALVDDASVTEGGQVFIDGDGKWVAHDRDYPALRTVPDLTVSVNSGAIAPGVTVVADMSGQVTTASGARPDGGVNIVSDQAAEAVYGATSTQLDLEVFTDAEVMDRLQWLVKTRATPSARIPSLTLDLLTSDATFAASVLAFPVDGHLRVTDLPSQMPGGSTRDFWVVGYSEKISASEWSWTANAVDWPTYLDVFILDDAGRGVLDSNRLGV